MTEEAQLKPPPNVLLAGINGSTAYGLATEDSAEVSATASGAAKATRRPPSGPIEKACEYCGKPVRRTPGNFRKHVFCNQKCYWESDLQSDRLKIDNPGRPANYLNCTGCGIRFRRPPGKQYNGKMNFHTRACMNDYQRRAARPRETQYGYLDICVGPDYPGVNASGRIMVHRKIMQEHLGRPLLKNENVHHKNGDRKDNRLSNLELWSTSQPIGQRVEDKLQWAREFLRLYEGVDLEFT